MAIVVENNVVATRDCTIGYSYDDVSGAFDRVWWTVTPAMTVTVRLTQGKNANTFTLTGTGSQTVAGRKYTMTFDPVEGWYRDFDVTVWE